MNFSGLSARAGIRIRATPSEVCRAFVNANEMSTYWFTRHDDGLSEGRTFRWFIGNDKNAVSFDVYVRELVFPHKLVVEWPGESGERRQVTWLFEESEGSTALTVEETGFIGRDDQIFEQVLDSTQGFNQVIVAAKAYIEFGAEMNVVADHL